MAGLKICDSACAPPLARTTHSKLLQDNAKYMAAIRPSNAARIRPTYGVEKHRLSPRDLAKFLR
jgi:hypothetical protein